MPITVPISVAKTQPGKSNLSGLPALALLSFSAIGGCTEADNSQARTGTPAPAVPVTETLPGGKASITSKRDIEPVATLPDDERPNFHAGKALAKQPWVRAPTTTTARDGLGPLYNSRSCFACHPNAGRGQVPFEQGQPMAGGGLVRLSVAGSSPIYGVVPEPTYGAQLQTRSVALSSLLGTDTERAGEVRPEAQVTLTWSTETFSYPDGKKVTLRSPAAKLDKLAYGPLSEGTLMSLRNAPPLFGLGLIEAIPQSAIDANVDEDDENRDGISGRLNRVWDRTEQRTVPGRFGHKANQPNLRQQVAAAFAGDIGITNPLFPEQPCTEAQVECVQSPSGANDDGFELPADLLALTVGFVRDLGVRTRPNANAPGVVRGRTAFFAARCATCHAPSFTTKSELPHLNEHTIFPFSDFLLHDMGQGLADGRSDFEASGSEWRTAPLWTGARYSKPDAPLNLLHDGRAGTYEEAILWHGGEASAARDAFARLPAEDRDAIIAFLESL